MNIVGIILLLLGLAVCWFIGNSYYKKSISKTVAVVLIVLVAFFSVRLALKGGHDLRSIRPRKALWTGFLLSSLMALLGLFRMNAHGNMACGCVSGSCSCGKGKSCCGRKGCNCKNGGTCLCDTKTSEKTTNTTASTASSSVIADPATYTGKKDDLKVVEGIGPVLEGFLNDHGVFTFAQLGAMEPEAVKEILDRAEERFRTHTTESRPLQARFAGANRMKELKEMKNELDGGKFISGGKYTKDSV